jgi:hypothetical protein
MGNYKLFFSVKCLYELNMDETEISSVQKSLCILGPKRQRQFGTEISWKRGNNVTATSSDSAPGEYAPPILTYPIKEMSPLL